MAKKTRRTFSDEQKQRAVEDYVSGRKSAEDAAAEAGVTAAVIYKWRVQLVEKARGNRIEELESQGHHPADVRKIISLEEELLAYKEKLAEALVHNDILKKLHGPLYPQLKNANSYDEIKRILDQSKRRAK